MKHLPKSHLVSHADADTKQRYPGIYTEITPDKLATWELTENGSFIAKSTIGIQLKIQIIDEKTWRIRYTATEFESDFSYALAADSPLQFIAPKVEEQDEILLLKAKQTTIRLSKADLQLGFIENKSDEILLEEIQPYCERTTILEGKNHVRVSFGFRKNEAYLGLGDKSWNLNLRGKNFENWNSDAFSYEKNDDPLYRAIPFYYGLNQGKAYGIFFHNSYKTHFDFNSHKDDTTRMWADGGEMDYFFFYGPKLTDVAQSYHSLTGVPELPPQWVLGFHQCRWSYYPESRVREVADTFRDLKIPCDAIYLDIDYMDGYRCFTWNKDYFPDPKKMINDLSDQGFQTVVMIDPGIRMDKDYAVYKSGIELDAFCKRSSGELMKGPVWPPLCVWPEYTNPGVRDWWGKLYQGLYENDNVSGFWNDMNEPAVFRIQHLTFPDDVLHDFDGHPSNHSRGHNIYGQQMARATFDGLKKIKPKKRPFVLTRATFSGGQREAALWTGDNIASWKHLRLANRQCQRLSISGFSLVGTDIGGFVGEPTGELMVRWLQLGIFHPVFRVHSMGNNFDGAAEAETDAVQKAEELNRQDQEPWAYGEPFTSQARKAIQFRYRLFPYLYTTLYRHTLTGQPVLRSLSFEDQTDQHCIDRENEFLVGDHLLVNPVTHEGATVAETYLPQGQWLDFFDGTNHVGQQFVKQSIDSNTIPIFVRAGAIIPFYPVQQYTGELEIEVIQLRTYYKAGTETSYLFLDAGDGYDYTEGGFLQYDFETNGGGNNFVIKSQRTGSFESSAGVFELKLYGLPAKPTSLVIDGIPINIIDFEGDVAVVIAPINFDSVEVQW